MSKLYTITRSLPISTNVGDSAYAHVLGSDGFSSLAKCTTAKRATEEATGWELVNFSYHVDGELPAPGGKVYTLQHKINFAEGDIYIQAGDDVGYLSKKAATKAKRALEGRGFAGMVIFSFIVDKEAAAPPAPVMQEFAVTRTIAATSQEEADRIIDSLLDMPSL
jgi:hypothetical protein